MSEVRGRLTERANRARLKLELRRGARPAAVVVAGLLLGLACFLFVAGNASKTLLRDTYEVRFAVDSATGVVPGRQEVRIKGIPAGNITKVEIVGEQAVLTAEIQEGYGPVYRDARAALRPNTALEDMYLDILDRGTRAAGLAQGEKPLDEDQTETSVNVEAVLNVFQADVRGHFRAMLDNLGNGLDRRGDALRAAFVEFVPFLQAAGRMSEQLAERGDLTERLVHNTAVLTTELGRRERQLRTLVRSGSVTLRTFQAGSADLDAIFRELPPTLAAIDTSFAAVRGVLSDVDAAMTSLRPVAGQLPGSLSALRRLSATAGPSVRALRPPVERLVPLVRTLIPLSSSLNDTAGALGPQTDSLDRLTAAIVGCERPIQGFFQWNPSLAKFYDLRGAIARGNLLLNLSSTGTVGDPNVMFRDACTPGTPIGGRPPRPEDER